VRRLLLALACVVLVTHPATAQQKAPPLSPAKVTLIRRILQLTNAGDLTLSAMEAALPAQRAANPQIPAEFWTEFSVRARRGVPQLLERLIPIYDANFSEAQLQQLVRFYESPLGRHLIAVQPAVTVQSIQAGQQWGAEIGTEVGRDLQRRGIQAPPQ
jgi:uncharacterized protein